MCRSPIFAASLVGGANTSKPFEGWVIESKYRDFLPTVLAAIAFVGFAIAFAFEMVSYERESTIWARRDLQSRADLAASTLAEPLHSQDFVALRDFGDRARANGLRLTILGAGGHGRVYDNMPRSDGEERYLFATQSSGDYVIRLGLPNDIVRRPFHRALLGFILAGSVGIAGVLLFFFVTYRQRVRIRELRRIERFRRDFIADISHEIKTPLTGILGAVDLLEGDSPLIDMIRKESKRLNSLVQSILDLARLEREGVALNAVETDLAELVRETAARYPCKIGDLPSCGIACDAQLIEQALSNLIGNAVRHSQSDDITISLSCERAFARIVVEDHGVGIPAEERSRIFERFHRVDPSRAAETGGAGLGLSIVKKIAELHHGSALVEPAIPRGSRFILSLPSLPISPQTRQSAA